VVFRPKHLAPEELLLGYDWLYRRLFSHASIWARRPEAGSELVTYLAGAYLYKHSNWLWRFLIERRLVRFVWRPLLERARQRHVALRGREDARESSRSTAARGGGSRRTPLRSDR
jgi:hypothetical protein